MKIPQFIRNNMLLKMTSLNAGVVGIRLLISFGLQRLMFDYVGGNAGMAKIGQLRSLSQLLTSITSLGSFNAVVKYLGEHRENEKELQKLFSTVFVFTLIGIVGSSLVLLFFAKSISISLFATDDFTYIIKLIAITIPFIGLQRVFNGVINGLSEYKKYSTIDLVSYLVSALLLVIFLLNYNLDGALIAIALAPVIQLIILLFFFIKTLKEYINFKEISFKTPLAKSLLAFTLMSAVSSILLPIVEIDIRAMLEAKISGYEAGVWTNIGVLSKNYMVFASSIFGLYVIPKFAGIFTAKDFKKEVFTIYRTLLPLFAVGMFIIFVFKGLYVKLLYPGTIEMLPLFKWQLMADFIRLAALILAHQFLAKKMVLNFIFSEIFSIALFYFLANYLVDIYGVEGVVIADFIRYILYFIVVVFLLYRYFNKQRKQKIN